MGTGLWTADCFLPRRRRAIDDAGAPDATGFSDFIGGLRDKAKAATGPSSIPSVGGSSITATNLRFKNGLYYELGKDDSPFTGKATKNYPTGKPWYARSYKSGKKHGPTIEWFPNSQKKYEMFYSENQRTGIWTYWNQEGKVTAKRKYEKNQFVKNLPLK